MPSEADQGGCPIGSGVVENVTCLTIHRWDWNSIFDLKYQDCKRGTKDLLSVQAYERSLSSGLHCVSEACRCQKVWDPGDDS